MKARLFVERVLLIAVMAVALWAAGAGPASAQGTGYLPVGCGIDDETFVPCICGPAGNEEELPTCPPVGPIVTCPTPAPAPCEFCEDPPFPPVTCTGLYTPDQRVNVFVFGDNNSIQIKFPEVITPFLLTVDLIPTTQDAFKLRVDSLACTPPAPLVSRPAPDDVTCNPTVDEALCAVYKVSPHITETSGLYVGPIDYLIGWLFPPTKGNKHDFFMLRDPDDDAGGVCFTENITFGTLIRNYTVGEVRDPGLPGRVCCTSEYVVARQRIRPVSK